ncbi:hypothetical protein GCM10007049_19310 [Echinicola pacifica]|uniref:Uncharacterized protein n=1 Tax=Echinicola pacifica TaxID=346377 RepID=A0A918PXP1_9BACT|nr:hypothetical protein [Echinicola pacifica]GGZ26729.1 hypothetical protein GCM10007049_19310 [Echinicola pacifica]
MSVQKIEKTVVATVDKLQKLKIEQNLIEELQWCLGSYRNDQNPCGLVEKSALAYEALKALKETNSRAVSKKLLEDLEKIAVA